jgi:hypothetical protein
MGGPAPSASLGGTGRGYGGRRHLAVTPESGSCTTGSGVARGVDGDDAGRKNEQKNDERSQYVVENKGSGLQTNPNEANYAVGRPSETEGDFWPPHGQAADFEDRFALCATTPSPPAPLPQRGEGRIRACSLFRVFGEKGWRGHARFPHVFNSNGRRFANSQTSECRCPRHPPRDDSWSQRTSLYSAPIATRGATHRVNPASQQSDLREGA